VSRVSYKDFGIRDIRGDLRKLKKAALIAPHLLTKSLPPTLRAGAIPFTREVKRQAKAKWPKQIIFGKGKTATFPRGVSSKTPKNKFRIKGWWSMRFKPRHTPSAVLMEFGSYKGNRTTKSGANRGKTGPIPVWRSAYAKFKAKGGPRNIEQLLLKQTQATFYRALTKAGMI